eukprot:TRINITY_DN11011_c0_g1_i1.p1 TRINITY_DN11011_c0_g1~~TRINITY_DN11011_c0_g1_i1.p1  ORF type:complete len:588 (-),score=109.36 TRINITY_DN11011_c0_g1_i1:701-2395(-)
MSMAAVGVPRCALMCAGRAATAHVSLGEGVFRLARQSLAWPDCKGAVPLLWKVRDGGLRRGHDFCTRASVSEGQKGNGGAKDASEYDYDLFAIGAGSGGVRAARFAAGSGARVAICELPFATISSDAAGGVGGTCVLRGCVPKKLLVIGSNFSHEFEGSKGFGWKFDSEPNHDWVDLIAAKNKEIQRLTGVYKSLLDSSGVELIEGRGKIVGVHAVEVNGKRYTARHILVAVGGRATVPNIPGKEYVITSDEALDLPKRPSKICIIGGGYIALEFAGIFNGFGTEVHVFIRGEKVLRGFDEEIRDFLADQMALKGIKFHFGVSPEAVEKVSDGSLKLVTNEGTETADCVMFATGRAPNTKNLGLETVDVKVDKKGAIEVDEYSSTSVDSIWAIGDVTNRLNLTPVALMEGMAFSKTVFGNQKTKTDHKNVPSAVFTNPPIGTVGLTEAEAVEQYGDVDIFTSNFRAMKSTLSGLPDRTFMKIIVDAETDRVLGMHICGDEAAEMLQGFAVAVKAGLKKSHLDQTIGIHPSSAEELVTMRTASRKIRQKTGDDAQSKKQAAVTSS